MEESASAFVSYPWRRHDVYVVDVSADLMIVDDRGTLIAEHLCLAGGEEGSVIEVPGCRGPQMVVS